MKSINKKKWSGEEYEKMLSYAEQGISYKKISKFLNRTEYAIIKKMSRGHSNEDRRNYRRHFIRENEDLKQSFTIDYLNNMPVKKIVSKYNLKDIQQVYNLAQKIEITNLGREKIFNEKFKELGVDVKC